MIAVIEDGYGKMRDILLLDNQLAKFVIEHEKDRLHVKQRTTIIVHTRSAMTIQHCINPPNFTKQALLFINGAQIIGTITGQLWKEHRSDCCCHVYAQPNWQPTKWGSSRNID